MKRVVLLLLVLCSGCPDGITDCAKQSVDPCAESVQTDRRYWPDYGADPVVGACWRRDGRGGASAVPCERVLLMPEFAALRHCPSFLSPAPAAAGAAGCTLSGDSAKCGPAPSPSPRRSP